MADQVTVNNTMISNALSSLLFYPELWYHTAIQIKVVVQTGTEVPKRDILLRSYRLEVRM